MSFIRGETVICSCTVKNSAGVLVDPSLSMNITIKDKTGGAVVDNDEMLKDSTGNYHYDWQTTALSLPGVYSIFYIATDGSRVSESKSSEELV